MKDKCPIERLKRYLIGQGVGESELDSIAEQVRQEILQAVANARAAPQPDTAGVLQYVYSSPSLSGTSG